MKKKIVTKRWKKEVAAKIPMVAQDESPWAIQPTDMRRLNEGDTTPWGPIAKCPCGQMGARHPMRLWRGATRFAHTLERIAGVADIRIIGNKYVDDGTT